MMRTTSGITLVKPAYRSWTDVVCHSIRVVLKEPVPTRTFEAPVSAHTGRRG